MVRAPLRPFTVVKTRSRSARRRALVTRRSPRPPAGRPARAPSGSYTVVLHRTPTRRAPSTDPPAGIAADPGRPARSIPCPPHVPTNRVDVRTRVRPRAGPAAPAAAPPDRSPRVGERHDGGLVDPRPARRRRPHRRHRDLGGLGVLADRAGAQPGRRA